MEPRHLTTPRARLALRVIGEVGELRGQPRLAARVLAQSLRQITRSRFCGISIRTGEVAVQHVVLAHSGRGQAAMDRVEEKFFAMPGFRLPYADALRAIESRCATLAASGLAVELSPELRKQHLAYRDELDVGDAIMSKWRTDAGDRLGWIALVRGPDRPEYNSSQVGFVQAVHEQIGPRLWPELLETFNMGELTMKSATVTPRSPHRVNLSHSSNQRCALLRSRGNGSHPEMG